MDGRRLRLLGLSALGVAGVVLVLATRTREEPGGAALDRAARREAPSEESEPARLVGSAEPGGAGPTAGHPRAADAGAPAVEGGPPAGRRVPLRVETVDARSGRPVASTWAPSAIAETFTWMRAPTPTPPAFRVIPDLDSGESREMPELPGLPLFRVYAPAGHVLEDPEERIQVPSYGAHVREVVAVVPLWPEAVLHVTVLDPDGRPAPGVTVARLWVAGRLWGSCDAFEESPGVLRIAGIPALSGEPVAVTFASTYAPALEAELVEIEEVPAGEPPASVDLCTEVPARDDASWRCVVRLREPLRDRQPSDIVETENDLSCEFDRDGDSALSPQGEPSARVYVRVIGCDGDPVARADVLGHTTDESGEVRLEGLEPGERRLVATAEGRFDAVATVDLAAGDETSVVLQEPYGANLHVLVTDEAGRSRPSARVEVEGARVFDVADGVQRVDPFTGPDGRRTFARVEPGTWSVVARWGSRTGSVPVTLADGEVRGLVIVAR